MVHIQLQLASLVVQLLVFKVFLTDVSAQLGLCDVEGLNTLVSVRLELLDLTFKSLLVFFITLLMFALNDLLRGFCHSIELDILSSLFEVFNLELHTLVDCLDNLQLGLVIEDFLHICNLLFSSLRDFVVLLFEDRAAYKDGIFVVRSDR